MAALSCRAFLPSCPLVGNAQVLSRNSGRKEFGYEMARAAGREWYDLEALR